MKATALAVLVAVLCVLAAVCQLCRFSVLVVKGDHGVVVVRLDRLTGHIAILGEMELDYSALPGVFPPKHFDSGPKQDTNFQLDLRSVQ